MKIRNAIREELDRALELVNEKYAGNIRFKRCDRAAKNGRSHIVTLTVNSSREPGARRAVLTGRRIAAACWHAHGDFFEALLSVNPDAVIKSCQSRIDSKGGNWKDYNQGSILYPARASELCEC